MRRDRHPFETMAFDALSRQFGIDPAEMRAYVERRRRAPRWLVDSIVKAGEPLMDESMFDVDESLPSSSRTATLHTMHTETASEIEQPKIGRPSKLKRHPLMAGLKKAGVTLAEEALNVRRSVSSVRSFCFPKDADAYRPIQRVLAERWRDVYGVPLKTWPRIVD